jgi:hypothetical protein
VGAFCHETLSRFRADKAGSCYKNRGLDAIFRDNNRGFALKFAPEFARKLVPSGGKIHEEICDAKALSGNIMGAVMATGIPCSWALWEHKSLSI